MPVDGTRRLTTPTPSVLPTKARYGSAVASYFHFYRWLVGTYIFIASLSLVWIVFHILKQVNQGRSTIFSATLIGESFSTPPKG